jgi:hypothetical protein
MMVRPINGIALNLSGRPGGGIAGGRLGFYRGKTRRRQLRKLPIGAPNCVLNWVNAEAAARRAMMPPSAVMYEGSFAMRGFALPLVLGTLLVSGALPAVAQPAPQTPYRHDYVEDAQARLRVWGRDMSSFNKAAAATGRAQDKAAGAALNSAWSDAKADERKLEVASAEDWEGARTAFDHASRRFEDALGRAHSHLN